MLKIVLFQQQILEIKGCYSRAWRSTLTLPGCIFTPPPPPKKTQKKQQQQETDIYEMKKMDWWLRHPGLRPTWQETQRQQSSYIVKVPYCNDPKNWTNSAEPDQTLINMNQGPYCLPFHLHTSGQLKFLYGKTSLFELQGDYSTYFGYLKI